MQIVFYIAITTVVALFAIGGPPAFAEGATAPAIESYAIDFRPLVEAVLVPILGALTTALATWLSVKAAALLKLQADDRLRAVIDGALQNGLAFGLSKLDDMTKTVPLTLEVKNQVIADAANYAIAAVPDALKKLGVTREKVTDLAAARLEVIVNPALPTPAV